MQLPIWPLRGLGGALLLTRACADDDLSLVFLFTLRCAGVAMALVWAWILNITMAW
jgi:hypothetical protein